MKMTKSQVAEMLGVSVRTVSDFQRDPDFPTPEREDGRNSYDAAAVHAWALDREIAKLIESEDGKMLDLNHERARLAKAQADRQEIALARERGLVIGIPEAVSVLSDDYSRVRARLLALPPKCAPLVHRAESVTEIRETLDDAVRDALAELSDPENMDGGPGGGGEPMPAEAA